MPIANGGSSQLSVTGLTDTTASKLVADTRRKRHTGNNNNGSHKPAPSSGLVAPSTPTFINPGGLAALPSLTPYDTAQWYAQLQSTMADLQYRNAAIRAQRVGVKAALQPILADIKTEKITGLNQVREQAIGQGLYGGSAELEQEIGVRGQAASARAEAKTGVISQLQQLKLENQYNTGKMAMTLQQLQAAKLAGQETQLASALGSNTIISGAEASINASGQIQTGSALPADSPLLKNYQDAELQHPAIHSLRLATSAGIDIAAHLTSSYRTEAQQASLYASKPGLAAAPGTSLHQQGLAIDVDTGWLSAHPEARAWLLAHGWHQFDAGKEPWHFSYGVTG